jgi:ACS family hexuronate transporter-like MFS transporter
MQAPSVPPPAPSAGNYRWLVCALLFFATTVNYVDRSILSLIKPLLDQELGWTNEQFGMVNGAFQFAYGVSVLWFGWFIDRVGTKIGYAVSIAAWSVAALGHSLVGSVTGFFVARISLGLGEGGNFPSAIKAVALWFPKRERALATSLFNSGSNVGAILAPVVVPWIALTFGWRAAFIAAGLAGFTWLFLWFPFYNVPEKITRLSAGELAHIRSDAEASDGDVAKISWWSLLGYRQTWSFAVAKFMTDPIWWFFLIWLPDYFNKSRQLNITKSIPHLVTIYTIVTVLSIVSTWVTGHLANVGWTVTKARKINMGIAAVCVVPVYFATQVGNWTAVLLIGLAAGAHQAWSANLFTTISDMFPKRAIASIVGIGGMAGAAGGVLFPVFSGWILDGFTARGDVTGGYHVLFAICAFAYVATFAIHHLLAPRFEQFEMKKT